MTDFKGNELHIGDKVIINVQTSTSGSHLAEGEITSFKNVAGYDVAMISYLPYADINHMTTYRREKGFSTKKIVKIL